MSGDIKLWSKTFVIGLDIAVGDLYDLLTISVLIFLFQIRSSSINICPLMFEVKLFEYIKSDTNVEDLIETQNTKSVAKPEQGVRTINNGETFHNLKIVS